MTENLPEEQRTYLAKYMKGVSRSFSLVAPEVDAPLDDYLATAYLVCRVVDNIEDTAQPFRWQQARFQEFVKLLDKPEMADSILASWEALNWPGLSDLERALMTNQDGRMLWQIYAEIPQIYRAPIHQWAAIMAHGMERSGNPLENDFFFSHGDIRLPLDAFDYDLYCFYVAGTVGRMITELAINFYGVEGSAAKLLADGSDACGRALQKTNIVKDFAKDLERNVCYLPGEWMAVIDFTPLELRGAPADWKKMVLMNVVAELDNSVHYVLALPKTAIGFRKAGLLMMLPAYETMLLAAKRLEDLFTPAHSVKISRTKMGQCVLRARNIAADDAAITTYANEISRQIRSELGLATARAN